MKLAIAVIVFTIIVLGLIGAIIVAAGLLPGLAILGSAVVLAAGLIWSLGVLIDNI